jgi:subtilisin family serine protease
MGSPALERAIQAAYDARALVVIAAGNSGTDSA